MSERHQMKELAEFLKTERLNRNMTLEEVSRQSGISKAMLTFLETCDFERFGAPLLIRNIIRAYCKALAIESEPLIAKFSSEIEKYSSQDLGLKKYGLRMKVLRRKRRMICLPLFALLLSSAGVFYGGMWISEKRALRFAPPAADRVFTQEELPAELQERLTPGPAARGGKLAPDSRNVDEALRTAEMHIRESATAAQKTGDDNDTGQPVKTEVLEKDLPLGADPRPRLDLSNSTDAVADDETVQSVGTLHPNKFAVEADAEVWIQVIIDDKETRSVMLHPGDRKEWTADKILQVIIGNAGGIHMTWNEQPVRAPRDPGRVLRFRLPDYAKAE